MKKALLIVAVALTVTSVSFAEEQQGGVGGFFKKLFKYPVKATKETGEMTANTLNNTGEKVVQPIGENTAAVVQGDVAKVGDLAAEPVVGAAETIGQTAAETISVPVEAAKEDVPATA